MRGEAGLATSASLPGETAQRRRQAAALQNVLGVTASSEKQRGFLLFLGGELFDFLLHFFDVGRVRQDLQIFLVVADGFGLVALLLVGFG